MVKGAGVNRQGKGKGSRESKNYHVPIPGLVIQWSAIHCLIGRRRGNMRAGGRSRDAGSTAMLDRGTNERSEKRVRRQWLGFKFRVKLAAQEPGVAGHFDDFDVNPVGRFSGDFESSRNERFLIIAIELVAVAMTLRNFLRTISA